MIDLVFRRRLITFGLTVNTERHLRGVRVRTDGSKLLKIQSDEVFGTDTTLKGRRQLLTLYKEQEGICPICHQEITEITEWHRHHIIWKSNGGKDTTENLVLLHPECHRQVHSLKLEVVKPRPERGVREARAD